MRSAVRSTLVALASIPMFAPLHAQVPGVPSQLSQTAAPSRLPQEPSLTGKERLRLYVKGTAGPTAFLLSATGAGINQARNNPSVWGQGMEGYGHRFGSSLAQRAIANTIQLGVEAALGEDSRYLASQRTGAWPRAKHVLLRSLVVRGAGGDRVPPVGLWIGFLGGGLLSRTWQPAGHDNFVDGLQSTGISFGLRIGEHVFREFWPDLKRHLPF